jgi:hypothetical protein
MLTALKKAIDMNNMNSPSYKCIENECIFLHSQQILWFINNMYIPELHVLIIQDHNQAL